MLGVPAFSACGSACKPIDFNGEAPGVVPTLTPRWGRSQPPFQGGVRLASPGRLQLEVTLIQAGVTGSGLIARPSDLGPRRLRPYRPRCGARRLFKRKYSELR